MTKHSLILIVLFLVLYLLPLGFRPMVSPDETRYGEIPREMLASGKWVVPHLNGIRYFEKPVLGYWLNALSMHVFGKTPFAIRLPSALAVGLSAWLVGLWAKRFLGRPSYAFYATLVFLLCFQVMILGIFCVLDSVFSCFITAALVSFSFAYAHPTGKGRRGFLCLCGLACGLGFLTKGLLAWVLPMIVVLPFLAWERRLKEMWPFLWIPIVTAILVVLPWGILVHLREPDFWHYFIWTEHISRFLSPKGGQHPFPVWFFIPIILGGALPWTCLVLPSFNRRLLKNNGVNRTALRMAICWFVMPFLFFSLSSGKLGTYILPCFAPLALLISVLIHNYQLPGNLKAFSTISRYVSIIPLLLLAALALAQWRLRPAPYDSSEAWKVLLVCIALIVWIVFSIKSGQAGQTQAKPIYFALAPALFMFSWSFVVPNAVIAKKMPTVFLATLPDIPKASVLVCDNYQATSACWFYDRNDVYLLGRTGEYAYGLSYDEARHRELDITRFNQLLENATPTQPVVLFTKTSRYCDYQAHIPKPDFKKTNGHLVFALFSGLYESNPIKRERSPHDDILTY